VLRILECARRCKTKDLLVGEDDEDDEDNEDDEDDEIAHTNNDAARWLLAYLGEFFPAEFVKSAQALDMPVHRGKWMLRTRRPCGATPVWASRRSAKSYFMSFFGHKFTVPEAAANKLSVHSAPPIVGRTEHMDRMLDCWCKDLVHLLAGQIANEHESQPAGFSYATVDFVIGADHGQGSFRAGIKVTCRKAGRSVAATAIYRLGEIECGKDTGNSMALAFTPKFKCSFEKNYRLSKRREQEVSE
jgi:hypothetical protein